MFQIVYDGVGVTAAVSVNGERREELCGVVDETDGFPEFRPLGLD